MINDDLTDISLMLKGCHSRRQLEDRFPYILSRLRAVVAAMARLQPRKRPRVDGPLGWLREVAADPACPLSEEQRLEVLGLADELKSLCGAELAVR